MSDDAMRDDWLVPTLQGLVDADAMAQLAAATDDSLWEAAVRRGLVTDADILAALSARFQMPIADLSVVAAEAREAVPEMLARRYRVLPLRVSGNTLEVATADPRDLDCERALGFATGHAIRMHLASPGRIAARIDEVYRPETTVDKLLEGMTQHEVQSLSDSEDFEDLNLSASKASERPIIKLVDHIIAEGIQQRASDIHLEQQDAGVAVSYRIDGVLRQAMLLPRSVGVPLVSRIKIMSGLDIADRLRPQDGRARVAVNGARVDLRVSTLPASYGEKVVIRVLDSRSTVLSLEGLGLTPVDLGRLQQLINLREGIVLVTGPTGSGKTTTLYSALRSVLTRRVNIVTVEDPVEYKLTGIVQVQVNERAGLTFAAALRSILRQDPDVVLVGEIRDRETGTIATQASLTGHLVLSTLHTIDAASAVARLIDIGVEPFKIAAALKGVIAQRLVRKLCTACKQPQETPVEERLRHWFPPGSRLFRAVGCAECAGTGYRGRLAVMEVLVSDSEMERRIAAAESTDRILEAARRAGMRSIWESAVEQVREGATDVDEIVRVLEVPTFRAWTGEWDRRQPDRRAGKPSAEGRTVTPPPGPVLRERTTRSNAAGFLPEEVLELVEDPAAMPATPRAERQRVLLVEDEEPLRQVLRDLLEGEGFEVVEAADGVHALDEVDRSAPDVVVLDLSLPMLDGYGVLNHLRARPVTAKLPVLVLTAKGDEDNEVQVFESGANDFMTKPFRPRALSARIRSLLRSK